MRLFAVTLFAVLAFASPALAVSNVSVDNTAPSAAAGARTLYKVGFTAGVALSGTDTMTVTLPGGTTTTSWQSATVRDVTRAVDVGSCNNPSSGLIVTCGLFSGQSINAGDVVLVTLRGITNPATTGARTLTVSTSKEPTAVTSSTYQVVGGNALSTPTVTINDPSAAAGAKTRYVIAFTVSPTGAMSNEAASGLTVALPAGTITSTWASGTVRDLSTATDVGSCNNPSGGLTINCGLFSSATVNNNDQLQITLRGITNGTAGNKTLTVTTTSDLPTATSTPYTVLTGNALSTPTVTINDPSAAAGAKTRYVIAFTVSPTGAMSNEAASGLTVALPAGTITSTWASGTVRDLSTATDVGSCNNPSGGLTINCGLFSSATVNNNDQLQITLRGITNGTAGNKTLTVTTTSDLPTATSTPYTVLTGNALSTPTVTINDPSAAAGAKTRYVIAFTVSPTGAMSNEAASGLTVALPAGTITSTWASGTVRDLSTATDVGSCNNPSGGLTINCGLFSSATVNNNDQLQITLRGITNGTAGNKTLTVTTTSDLPTATSTPYTVLTGNALSTPTVTISDPSAAAGAKTRYVIAFTVSPTGAMSNEAASGLTVALPAGTITSTWASGTVRDLSTATDVGSCNNPSGGLTINCGLFSSATVNNNDQLQITLRGITNGTAGNKTLTVTTTSDLPTATSTPYTVLTGNAVSAVSARIGTANPFAVVRVTTSATGGLSNDAGSSLTLTFPAGTTFPSFQTASVYDLERARAVGFCSTPVGTVVTCGLFSSEFVSAGDTLRISFPSTVNTTVGATVAVASSSDTAASGTVANGDTTSPDTTISAAAPFTFTSTEANSTYECRMDGGPWAACSQPYTPTVPPGAHTLDVRAIDPAGNPDLSPASRSFTVLGGPQITSGPVGLTNINTPTFTFTGTGTFTCRVDTAAFTTCSSPLTSVALTDGTHTFDVRDSTSATASRTFTVDTVPPDTTIAGAGTFTFTGGSSYECSVDEDPFSACASPYTPPPALPPGGHRLTVRSVDAAGNRDGTPSTTTFTVAAPDPTPTAIPTVQPTPTPIPSVTPTPTPVPNKSVVAQTESGTACVQRPGSSTCVPLTAGQTIPLGSIVDARKGAVDITASATDKAKFYDGIFKITQKGGYTNLALVETLAPCPKQKGKAAAAKPKKRKLWGDGKGKFRTEGKYAAATVRGTKWLVEDSCAGTKTTVAVGVVDVRDNVLHKTVVVRAKKSYTAKPKR